MSALRQLHPPTQNHPVMPQGSQTKYSAKQKREAAHIEKSYKKRGVSGKEAAERAWRTVNKQDGGAKKSAGSARIKRKKT
jgi:hypothetical protein